MPGLPGILIFWSAGVRGGNDFQPHPMQGNEMLSRGCELALRTYLIASSASLVSTQASKLMSRFSSPADRMAVCRRS
jgi:hypothetical protein